MKPVTSLGSRPRRGTRKTPETRWEPRGGQGPLPSGPAAMSRPSARRRRGAAALWGEGNGPRRSRAAAPSRGKTGQRLGRSLPSGCRNARGGGGGGSRGLLPAAPPAPPPTRRAPPRSGPTRAAGNAGCPARCIEPGTPTPARRLRRLRPPRRRLLLLLLPPRPPLLPPPRPTPAPARPPAAAEAGRYCCCCYWRKRRAPLARPWPGRDCRATRRRRRPLLPEPPPAPSRVPAAATTWARPARRHRLTAAPAGRYGGPAGTIPESDSPRPLSRPSGKCSSAEWRGARRRERREDVPDCLFLPRAAVTSRNDVTATEPHPRDVPCWGRDWQSVAGGSWQRTRGPGRLGGGEGDREGPPRQAI